MSVSASEKMEVSAIANVRMEANESVNEMSLAADYGHGCGRDYDHDCGNHVHANDHDHDPDTLHHDHVLFLQKSLQMSR